MFKFDKKVSDTIKMADKSKEKISRAEQIMRGIKIPETFENRGKITENIELLNTASKGIKAANRTLDKKINEIVAIGKKTLNSNKFETKGMNLINLASDSSYQNIEISMSEYEETIDFVNRFIDWDKFKESHQGGSDLLNIVIEYIFKLWNEYLNNNILEEELRTKITKELYNNYGIRINSYDIEKIDKTNTNTIIVSLNDGTLISLYGSKSPQYTEGYRARVFKSGQQFYLMSDGEIILDDSIQEQIKEGTEIKEDIKIKGFETITVNGHKVNIFWVGDDVPYYTFQEMVKDVKEQLSKYISPELLENILESEDFKGFFVGTNSSIDSGLHTWDYQALAISDEYIYINAGLLGALNAAVTDIYIVHEFGHIFDATNKRYSLNRYSSDERFQELYVEYKQKLQKFTWKGYNRIMYPGGIPNETEFFAELFTIYCAKPEDLKEAFPELYDYMEELIESI